MNRILEHTNQLGECFVEVISSLARDCDHEYYISAMGPPHGTIERATRGRSRILEGIKELENLKQKVTCLACGYEIKRLIKLQREGVSEIEKIWKLSP